jgi:hypothetical protein
MSDILVDPTDGCRGLVVVSDVTHELACKVFDRSKTPSGMITVRRMRVCEATASSMSIALSENGDPFDLVKIERIDPETGAVLGGRYNE